MSCIHDICTLCTHFVSPPQVCSFHQPVRAEPGLPALLQQDVLLQQRQGQGLRSRVEPRVRQSVILISRGNYGHRYWRLFISNKYAPSSVCIPSTPLLILSRPQIQILVINISGLESPRSSQIPLTPKLLHISPICMSVSVCRFSQKRMRLYFTRLHQLDLQQDWLLVLHPLSGPGHPHHEPHQHRGQCSKQMLII